MDEARKEIERIKKAFASDAEEEALRYKRSLIRELDYIARQSGKDIDEILRLTANQLRIKNTFLERIKNELIDAKEKISAIHDEYFSLPFSQSEFDKISALFDIDFSSIKSVSGNIIEKELKRAIAGDYSYSALRSRLEKRGIGNVEANTLANTALAQFDNAYMFENAAQAGIEKFVYDGVLHPNSRPFCKEHLNKVYTLAEIEEMDNGQKLPVKTSCGGYNCTHYWTPYFEQLSGQN
jgi:hypothetical protein